MALEQCQPLSQNNQDAHLEAYPRSVDFLVDLLKYCKFTSRRFFSKYKPSTKKRIRCTSLTVGVSLSL